MALYRLFWLGVTAIQGTGRWHGSALAPSRCRDDQLPRRVVYLYSNVTQRQQAKLMEEGTACDAGWERDQAKSLPLLDQGRKETDKGKRANHRAPRTPSRSTHSISDGSDMRGEVRNGGE
ncbi:hypothetical protein K431DRAFT_327140 [Polychaeton citri CBS 116435]|uniref:Secreted protein n=1 Tax=Polychaeton citri CBS 116435 TaxID=1314669 RepID=A0A9P4Q9X9_9PEZI|nr:hypothetical protein K431DRAFT_327140 [Polychaeton citri CBS 116435]